MDKTTLVEADIATGLQAVKALEAAGLPIAIAMWLKLHGALNWQLYIASPDVEKYGPTSVIRFVDRILTATHCSLSLSDITITNTTNHFVNEFRRSMIQANETSGGFDPIRIAGLSLGGVDIDEAIIYKIAPGIRPSKHVPKPDIDAIKRARALAA